ncbi:MAG: glycosyltransferase family 4 protein [Candidatus Thorarchaeota archaeon]
MAKKNFRLLTFAGLFNRLLDAHLSFIIEGNDIHVDVVRSHIGTPDPKITYHFPPKTVSKNPILDLLWKFIITIRLALSRKFDAIYAIYSVPHLYLAYIASVISRKPLIYTCIAGPTEFKINGWLVQRISRKIVRRVNLVIVRMNTTGDYLIKEFGVKKRKIVQYPMLNLPAIRHFYPLNIEKTNDLVVVSLLRPDKHIELFIDIVDRLKKTIPDITAAIVGDGPLREFLEDYTKSKGLSDNITFHGFISSTEKINQILNSSHAFILNSSHEGAPNTIVEAMNAGIFCVASRVGEVPIRITHGYNGFIVDQFNDIDTYVSILQELLRNPGALVDLQRKAAESKKNLSRKALVVWRAIMEKLLESRE